MVQSVELLLDEATDDAVRAQWAALAAAGLPSQARHTGATNAPHVTLAVASTIPAELEPGLVRAVAGLPLPVLLGGLVVFGGRRHVLARSVVPTAGLLSVQAGVAEVLAGCPGLSRQLTPGRWTAHVTLGRGLSHEQVGPALAVLDLGEVEGLAVAARRWDGEARVAWRL